MKARKTTMSSIDTTAEVLCTTNRTVYRLIAAGKLEAVKLGRRTLVKNLDDYVDSLPAVRVA